MTAPLRRGRLLDVAAAPASGERFEVLLETPGVVVEQILSAASVKPVPYLQDQDEWVVVLQGSAVLDVGGEPIELGSGDWVLLPAQVPHTVLSTAAGTSWLAVHVHPPIPAQGGAIAE